MKVKKDQKQVAKNKHMYLKNKDSVSTDVPNLFFFIIIRLTISELLKLGRKGPKESSMFGSLKELGGAST